MQDISFSGNTTDCDDDDNYDDNDEWRWRRRHNDAGDDCDDDDNEDVATTTGLNDRSPRMTDHDDDNEWPRQRQPTTTIGSQ